MGGTGGPPSTDNPAGVGAGTGTAGAVPSWIPSNEAIKSIVSNLGFPTTGATTASSTTTTPTATATSTNPTATSSAFTHTPYQKPTSTTPIGATPTQTTATTTPTKTDTSTDDWVYVGDLPQTFNKHGTMTGYGGSGSAGNFGYSGVAGSGGYDLPKLTGGTVLTGQQVADYNRIKKSEYDRNMKLYGVGWDKKAYEDSLRAMDIYMNSLNVPAGGG